MVRRAACEGARAHQRPLGEPGKRPDGRGGQRVRHPPPQSREHADHAPTPAGKPQRSERERHLPRYERPGQPLLPRGLPLRARPRKGPCPDPSGHPRFAGVDLRQRARAQRLRRPVLDPRRYPGRLPVYRRQYRRGDPDKTARARGGHHPYDPRLRRVGTVCGAERYPRPDPRIPVGGPGEGQREAQGPDPRSKHLQRHALG